MGLIPGWEAKIPHASQPKNQNINQKQSCNKFNKDFNNCPYQRIKNFKKIFVYVIFLKSFKTAPEVFKINFIFPNGDKYGKHTFQLLFSI